jgi:hypothetical protein
MVGFKLWWVFVNGIMDWLLGSNDCLYWVFKTFFWVHYASIKLKCPMMDYEKMKNLLEFLKDLKNPSKTLEHGAWLNLCMNWL